jgi:hypothetical protein
VVSGGAGVNQSDLGVVSLPGALVRVAAPIQLDPTRVPKLHKDSTRQPNGDGVLVQTGTPSVVTVTDQKQIGS